MLPPNPKKTMPDFNLGGTALEAGPNGLSPVHLPVAWNGGLDAEGSGLPPALAATPSMGTFFQALRRRWLMMLTLGLLGAGLAAAGVWFLMPGMYSTDMILEFERPPRGSYEGDFDILNFKRAQTALLKSYPVLSAALKKPALKELAEVSGEDDRVDWLQKALVTDELLGPSILRVTFSGDDPEAVQVILSEVGKAYLKEFVTNEQKKLTNRKGQLEESYRSCADTLRKKRQKLRARKEDLGLDEPDTLAVRYQAMVKQLEDAKARHLPLWLELRGTQVERAAALAKLKSPSSLDVSPYAIEEEIQKDPVVKSLTDRLLLAEGTIQKIRGVTSKEAQGNALQGPQAERDEIAAALTRLQGTLTTQIKERLQAKAVHELRDNAAKLQSKIESLEEQKKTLEAKIKALDTEVESLRFAMRSPDKLPPDLLALKDEVDQTELLWKKIGEELATLQVGAMSPRVNLIESSKVPQSKDIKRQVKVAGMAGIGVFGMIVLGVVMVESRKRRVYEAKDVVQGLGINLVGTLPALPPHTRRAVPAVHGSRDVYWQNIMTESVDVIRTVLLHSAHIEALRVVMVTSAVGGEGKTSLASHLAASLARAWRKTLLIDCDLRNPAAHQQFDLPLEPGLSEVLRGEVEYEDVIRPTPVSRLWMMPAGKWDSHAIQALAQEGVRSFFDQLKEQYDFIILDSCPVLPVADSMLIGQHADAVLFSILRDVSRMPAVYAAHQRLAALGIRMLGAVVIGEKMDSYSPGYHQLTQTPG